MGMFPFLSAFFKKVRYLGREFERRKVRIHRSRRYTITRAGKKPLHRKGQVSNTGAVSVL